MQPGRARTSGLGVPLLPLARWVGWVAPVRPTHGVLVLSCPSAALRVCSVLGRLAPVHRCARAFCCVVSAVSWASWLLFTGVLARCVVLRVRCPGPLGSCSPVRPLGVLCCVCGVPGHLPPVHRCARSVCCFACAVSWATWLMFTGAPARCVVLYVQCPGPLGSCSPVRPLGVLLRVCGVLGPLAPVHRCARSVCCFACAVSWASWLLFTGVPARCVVLRVRCPGPPGSCSPVCPLGVLFCVCGVLGQLAPVHRCARSVCCFACAVSCATWLLFTGVPARCVVLRVRCPGPPGSCSAGLRVCLLLSPRSLPLPFPCSSLFAGLFCFVFFFLGGGLLGSGVFCAVRGCGCVPVPVLVWAWVSWGTGVGWLLRSGFPVCAPAPRLPVFRAPVRGVLTAAGWRQWWRGACVGGRGSWVVPGWRGRARACVWVCSWRGLMGWWAVWAWLVCVGVTYVCAEGAVGWAEALWAMQWVEEMLVTPTGGVL